MLSLFLARKYLAKAYTTNATASSCYLSMIVLFVGSLALALALSITSAFEEKVFNRLQGINAHAIIYSYGSKIDDISIAGFLKRIHPNEIRTTTPQSAHSVIITKDDKQAVITLRGIHPKTESQVTCLAEKVIHPKNLPALPFVELFDKNKALIGHSLAEKLGISVGDEITFFVPETATSSKRIKLSEHTVIISGFFNIGLEEFDGNTSFCSLDFFNKIFDVETGSDTLLISIASQKAESTFFEKIKTFFQSQNPFGQDFKDSVIQTLKKDLSHLTVSSWKDLYPAILSAMKLEKCAVIGIIMLLTIVALMNVISTLFTLVNRKQRDIALFMAIGMPNTIIRNIFVWMGIGMIATSSILGSATGFLISFMLETYKLIPLPDIYYVNYLPASTDLSIFIAVPAITLILGFIIILISVSHIQKIDALDVLRHTA